MFQRLGLVFIVLALLLAVVASGGFSATLADREVSVSVVDDDNAYVGYEPHEISATTNGTVEESLVTITNRLHTDIGVTEVAIDDSPGLVGETESPANISPGSSGDIVGEITCEEALTADVHVTVTVEGSGVAATVFGDAETRTVTVTCESQTDDGTDSQTEGTDDSG